MAKFTLHEQANRYLAKELALQHLSDCMSDIIIQEFRHGKRNDDESKLASALVAIFADYDYCRNHLGWSADKAEAEFRELLIEHLADKTAKAS